MHRDMQGFSIKGYVARNENGTLNLFLANPQLMVENENRENPIEFGLSRGENHYTGLGEWEADDLTEGVPLPANWFLDLQFEDDPKPVRGTIRLEEVDGLESNPF